MARQVGRRTCAGTPISNIRPYLSNALMSMEMSSHQQSMTNSTLKENHNGKLVPNLPDCKKAAQ